VTGLAAEVEQLHLRTDVDERVRRRFRLAEYERVRTRSGLLRRGLAFDRLIAATAMVERLPLVTADERIRKSGVVKVW
jgi:PIN domain nuclease of toxin-antitoxin system